jgi:hypothetical protein
MQDGWQFSLASGLPSPASAKNGGSSLFDWFISNTPESDSSAAYMTGVRHCAFPVRSESGWTQTLQRSPGSRTCSFSTCLGSSTTQGPERTRKKTPPPVWPSPDVHRVGTLNFPFSKLINPARRCLCLRFDCHLTATAAKLEVRMVRYSFPVGLSHSLLHAGLSRRTHNSGTIPPFRGF